MRAAIYTRYSCDNQSEKSIDDQIRVCRAYCDALGITISPKHIFTDEAMSGSLTVRPALQSLEKAAENKEFEALVVDDLSRLSRSNHQMLTLILKFNYLQIKIIAVSDGISTDDENSKLSIQLRGLVNELYLDDLRKKTMRGLEGQKLRGFSTGEKVYGYYSAPIGELRLNKKGVAKYEGMVHKINPDEAEIVKRIYREFSEGKSIRKLVITLNTEKVPTRHKLPGGWNGSTVSRILKNEKYAGVWNWRKTKNVKDPMTGKSKSVPREQKELSPLFREDLIIIGKELWDKVQKRRADLGGTWPVSKKRKTSYSQKSYVHTSPTCLFSGIMQCKLCSGAITLVSGKGTGYYGCYNNRRKTCSNSLYVPRKQIEKVIIRELGEKLLTADNLDYIYQKVEKLAAESLNEVPELSKKRKAQQEKLKKEIHNYMNFIRSGNFSKTVSDALNEAEKRNEDLRIEIESLEFQKEHNFKAPPREWINHRLSELRETLNQDTVQAALALKELLSPITLEPVLNKDSDYYQLFGGEEKDFKPYYVAHTKIRTLSLLSEGNQGADRCRVRPQGDLNPCYQDENLVS